MAYKHYLDFEGLQRVLKQVDDLYISRDEKVSVDWVDVLNKPSIVTLGDLINYVKAEELENYYTKEQLDGKISGIYHFKGNVDNYEALNSISNPSTGDVYNVVSDGMNVAWNGESWDEFGTIVDLSNYITKDELQAITKDEIDALFIKLENQQSTVAFAYALTTGGNIIVEKPFTVDVGLTKADRITVSKNSIIELGENVISAPATMSNATGSANWSVFYVDNGATVTLNASENGGIIGEVEPTENDGCFCGTTVHEDSVLNVYGGTYITGQVCFYALKGTINIYGGAFTSAPWKNNNKPYTLNCQNSNYQAGIAKINVYGGSFCDFDPSNPTSDDARNYVVEGYKVVSEERDGHIWYNVIKE